MPEIGAKKNCSQNRRHQMQLHLLPLIWAAATQRVLSHGSQRSSEMDFLGKDFWSAEYMQICDTREFEANSEFEDFCTRYMIDFAWVNVEVVSFIPMLFVFRGFYAPHNVAAFKAYIDQKELQMQKVLDLKNEQNSSVHLSRRANGTWIDHHESEISSKLFNQAVRSIPAINFHTSEQWHALSYQPGGHYAPHYDYLEYESEAQHDSWMRQYNNRLATFLAVLETADEGGGTVFPRLKRTVHPNSGDVIFWFNMNPTGDQAEDSLHGACPILKGRKTAVTLWIRQKGSSLSMLTAGDNQIYDPLLILSPPEEYIRKHPNLYRE